MHTEFYEDKAGEWRWQTSDPQLREMADRIRVRDVR